MLPTDEDLMDYFNLKVVWYVQVFVSFFSENLGPGFDDGCDGCEFKIIFGSFRSPKGRVFSFS